MLLFPITIIDVSGIFELPLSIATLWIFFLSYIMLVISICWSPCLSFSPPPNIFFTFTSAGSAFSGCYDLSPFLFFWF